MIVLIVHNDLLDEPHAAVNPGTLSPGRVDGGDNEGFQKLMKPEEAETTWQAGGLTGCQHRLKHTETTPGDSWGKADSSTLYMMLAKAYLQ